VEKGYDLTQNKAFDPTTDPTKQSTSKTKFETLIVRSDGATPLNGAVLKTSSSNTHHH